MRTVTGWWTILVCLLAMRVALAQEIDQLKGVDSRVDYAALTNLGPWDDRNYNLTLEDLALLAPAGEEPREATPAFFRVQMRRAWPALRRSGPAQYPRSALNIFRAQYGGYLVGGRLYPGAEWDDSRYQVVLERGTDFGEFFARLLNGEVRVTTPEGAAESAVAINPADPNLVVASSNGPGGGQRMHYSDDGGETWQQAAALPLGGTCCDLTVEWSSDGSKAYAATLGSCTGSGCGVWFYRSADDGAWTDLESVTPGDPRRELTTSGSDKEFLHVDRYSGSPFIDHLYLTWHDNNVMQFAASDDGGNTWSVQAFSSTSDQLGIGSDITAATPRTAPRPGARQSGSRPSNRRTSAIASSSATTTGWPRS